MTEAVFKYDEIGDTLYISFMPGKKATGIALNDQLLLRIDKQARQAVGVTIFDYSYLAQPTDMGVRSLPLTGLAELSDELRELVLEILRKPPVNAILLVSTYSPSVTQTVSITLLQTEMLATA
ncbi:MAG: DUF2283 domain-containing protein [Chloroflexota bacterium]|nr:DUF2283 domain-containing protein [Chloroflexota bacterium]